MNILQIVPIRINSECSPTASGTTSIASKAASTDSGKASTASKVLSTASEAASTALRVVFAAARFCICDSSGYFLKWYGYNRLEISLYTQIKA